MGLRGKKAARLLESDHMRSEAYLIPASLDYEILLARYLQETPSTHRKQYGQFFTPPPIAELMMNWILVANPRAILDPAAGPGIFIAEFLKEMRRPRFLPRTWMPTCSIMPVR